MRVKLGLSLRTKPRSGRAETWKLEAHSESDGSRVCTHQRKHFVASRGNRCLDAHSWRRHPEDRRCLSGRRTCISPVAGKGKCRSFAPKNGAQDDGLAGGWNQGMSLSITYPQRHPEDRRWLSGRRTCISHVAGKDKCRSFAPKNGAQDDGLAGGWDQGMFLSITYPQRHPEACRNDHERRSLGAK